MMHYLCVCRQKFSDEKRLSHKINIKVFIFIINFKCFKRAAFLPRANEANDFKVCFQVLIAAASFYNGKVKQVLNWDHLYNIVFFFAEKN